MQDMHTGAARISSIMHPCWAYVWSYVGGILHFMLTYSSDATFSVPDPLSEAETT